MDFEKIIEKIKTDKGILNKILIILGLFFITSMLEVILQVLNYSSRFMSIMMDEDLLIVYQAISLIVLPILVSIVLFPVTLYLNGYKYESIAKGRLDEHGDIMGRINTALAYLFASFSINLVFGLLLTTLIIIFIAVIIVILQGLEIAAMTILLGIILIMLIVFIAFIVFTLINSFILPTMMFIFLKYRKISSMFDIHIFKTTFNKVWKDLLLLILINIVIGSVLGILGFILCLLGPLSITVVETFRFVINTLLLAQIYSKYQDSI